MGIELEKKERDSFFKLYYITFTKFILLRKTLTRGLELIFFYLSLDIHYEIKSLTIVNIYH